MQMFLGMIPKNQYLVSIFGKFLDNLVNSNLLEKCMIKYRFVVFILRLYLNFQIIYRLIISINMLQLLIDQVLPNLILIIMLKFLHLDLLKNLL